MAHTLIHTTSTNTLIQKTNHSFLPSVLAVFLVLFFTLSLTISELAWSSSRISKPHHSKELSLKTISEPKDQELCFSPEEPCDLKLTKFIQTAKQSIDIAVYDINRDQLVHELIVASRKIPVRVIVDQRQSKGNHSLVPLLIKAGIPVRFGRQRGYMHNKFTIVDRKMIETGSYNYTNHATEANHENQIYLGSPTIVERYQNQFNGIWNHAKPAA
jgi:phosphatidylserine/phosphatidylglycerophosphate/cardiolipin synthase-like enzyme